MVFFLFILAVFAVLWYSKVSFLNMREGAEKLNATVIEYRNEKGPMRNDYTEIPYPYVRIEGSTERLIRLKYASSGSKPFEINETVHAFWFAGILYYWEAYDKGMYKYIPGKINFIK